MLSLGWKYWGLSVKSEREKYERDTERTCEVEKEGICANSGQSVKFEREVTKETQ